MDKRSLRGGVGEGGVSSKGSQEGLALHIHQQHQTFNTPG